jgi:hypothetical protein
MTRDPYDDDAAEDVEDRDLPAEADIDSFDEPSLVPRVRTCRKMIN